jgi:hypothetical protein
MSTCNWLDLQTLGSQPFMLKESPRSLAWTTLKLSNQGGFNGGSKPHVFFQVFVKVSDQRIEY